MRPAVSETAPERTSSGRSLAVAGARPSTRGVGGDAFGASAGGSTIGDGGRPWAVATNTCVVSCGDRIVSAPRIERGGIPAAESTQRFMFAIRVAVALSALAFFLAAFIAESGDGCLGGMKVENCACTAAGAATSNAIINHRRST